MANVIFKRGTGNLPSFDVANNGTLFFNEKTGVITLSGATEYINFVDVVNVAAAPTFADAIAGKLYIVNNESLAFKGESAMVTLGTSEEVQTLKTKIDTLIGTDTNKSVRTIANEELAAQLIPEGAKESLDTLTEIATWIQNHPDDASAMNTAIAKLQAIVAGIGGEGEKATIVAYVTDAIDALKIGDYAKAADLTALATRVTTAEGKLDTLNGADTVEGSVAKALKDAKAYTDEKDTAMDGRMDTAETAITTLNGADTVTGSVAEKIKTAVGALDVTDTAVEGKYVSAITQTDGKIEVTRADLPQVTWGTFGA